jgi:hypothetical protein
VVALTIRGGPTAASAGATKTEPAEPTPVAS